MSQDEEKPEEQTEKAEDKRKPPKLPKPFGQVFTRRGMERKK